MVGPSRKKEAVARVCRRLPYSERRGGEFNSPKAQKQAESKG